MRRSRHHTQKTSDHGRITNTVSIRQRPAEAEDRAVPGLAPRPVHLGRGQRLLRFPRRRARVVPDGQGLEAGLWRKDGPEDLGPSCLAAVSRLTRYRFALRLLLQLGSIHGSACGPKWFRSCAARAIIFCVDSGP